jgi:hypothetical protein
MLMSLGVAKYTQLSSTLSAFFLLTKKTVARYAKSLSSRSAESEAHDAERGGMVGRGSKAQVYQ